MRYGSTWWQYLYKRGGDCKKANPNTVKEKKRNRTLACKQGSGLDAFMLLFLNFLWR